MEDYCTCIQASIYMYKFCAANIVYICIGLLLQRKWIVMEITRRINLRKISEIFKKSIKELEVYFYAVCSRLIISQSLYLY